MGWIVHLTVPSAETEIASSLLWSMNTTGIAELERHPVRGSGADDGVALVAGFEREVDASAAVETLTAADIGRDLQLSAAEDAGPERQAATVEVDGVSYELALGAAFGDGGHPSTRLALELLATRVTPGARVLDFGTGTGILAVAALARGAGSVLAIDNDPAALAVAEANLGPARDRGADVEVGDRLPEGERRFDLILANVLLPVHRQVGAELAAALAPDGGLVVSGILISQLRSIGDTYPGLTTAERSTESEWAALVLRP